MVGKALVITLVAIIGSVLLLGCASEPSQIQVQADPLPEQAQQRLLQATVQMTMLRDEVRETEVGTTGDNATLVAQQQVSIVAHGIGTLVDLDGQPVLVTHNHWPQVVDATRPDRVIFYDAHGSLLLEIDGVAFQSDILYRDGGTLVLSAPQGLLTVVQPVHQIGDHRQVVPGDIVHVARHRPDAKGAVGFLAAQVTAVDHDGQHVLLTLQSADGQAIEPGDSGGGIWANGTLVGNMWMTMQEQWHFDDSPEPAATVATPRSRAAGLTEDLLSLLRQSLDNLQQVATMSDAIAME